jgi:nucleotidyltransferase/DNA polymerase involved in DNA repair
MTAETVLAACEGGDTPAHRQETILRAQAVADLLLEGVPTSEIYTVGQERWGLGRRAVDKLIALGRRQLVDAWQVNRAAVLAQTLGQAQAVYRQAMSQGNCNAAIGALGLIARLARLE